MKKIVQDIEFIMNTKKNDSLLSFFLYILSQVYGSILKLRAFLYERQILKSEQLPCKVISIGNITAGGTGKTPMTILLAQMLQNKGLKTVIISRGYKGKAEKKGGIVSNGQEILMNSGQAGDEPFMMAERLKNIPVIIGKNRIKSADLAVKYFKPDIILLDDAFQHLKIKRDINIVLLDNENPFGNTHVIPRGMLREPLSALIRGHIFVLTRCDEKNEDYRSRINNRDMLNKIAPGKPIFTSYHTPCINKIIDNKNSETQTDIKPGKVVAFSGIAKNEDFLKTVKGFGCSIVCSFGFPDHHPYSVKDINVIIDSAKKAHADMLVTTEKDYARMDKKISWPVPLVVIGIDISINEKDRFCELVLQSLAKSELKQVFIKAHKP